MFAPTLLTAPAGLFFLLAAAAAGDVAATPMERGVPGDPAPIDCQLVEGQIDGRANHFGLDLHGFKLSGGGRAEGSIAGDVSVQIRRTGRRGPETDVAVKMTASTASGPVVLEGVVAAQRMHHEDPLHVVRGSLEVRSGNDATVTNGVLQVVGTADTKDRLISIRYSGQVCTSGARP